MRGKTQRSGESQIVCAAEEVGTLRLSCLQENLARGLSVVGRAVASKSTLPVLGNILLATDEGRLKLAATNLEVGITCWVGAKVEEEGSITVPARLLTEFVNSLPPDQVDMALNARTLALGLKCAQFKANIKGIAAEEFPPIPTIGEGLSVRLDPEALQAAIGQVAFAAATDDTRPVLTGVLMGFEGNELTLAAADGYRLAVRRLELTDAVPQKLDIVVPARSLQELARILSGEAAKGAKGDREPVEVHVTPNSSQVLFHLSSVDLVSRLVEGNFPNYRQIIPQRYVTRAVLTTAEFQKAARIASFFARDSNNVIKLRLAPSGEELKPGEMTVEATAAEIGDAISGMPATIVGDNMQVAFNVKYISDVLSVIDTAQVALEVVSPSSPGVLKPVGKDDYIHVVMPMHLASR